MTTVDLAMIAKVDADGLAAFERALRSVGTVAARAVILIDERSHPLTSRRALDPFNGIVDAVSRPWCGSFAAARNAVHEYTDADWLLVLDADEELEPGDLRQLIDSAPDDVDGITVETVCWTEGGPQSCRQIRAYRRERCHWERPVHNRLVGVKKALHSTSKVVTSYAGTAVDRAHRQIPALLQLLRDDPDDAHALRYLGRSLLQLGNARDAADALGRCCHVAPDEPNTAEAWTDWSKALAAAGEFSEAWGVACAGLQHHAANPSLWHQLVALAVVGYATRVEHPEGYNAVPHFRPADIGERVAKVAELLQLPLGVRA